MLQCHENPQKLLVLLSKLCYDGQIAIMACKALITLAITDWFAIVISDWRLLSNQSEESSSLIELSHSHVENVLFYNRHSQSNRQLLG